MSETSSATQSSCFSTCWKWTSEHKTEITKLAIATILLVAGAYCVHQSVYGTFPHLVRWCVGMPLIVGGMAIFAFAIYLLCSKNPQLEKLKAFLHEEAQKNKIKPDILESDLENIFKKKLSTLAGEINTSQGFITYKLLKTAVPLLGLSDAEVLTLPIKEIELYNEMQLIFLRYRIRRIISAVEIYNALEEFPEGLKTVGDIFSLRTQDYAKANLLKTNTAYLLTDIQINHILNSMGIEDASIKCVVSSYNISIFELRAWFGYDEFMRLMQDSNSMLALTKE